MSTPTSARPAMSWQPKDSSRSRRTHSGGKSPGADLDVTSEADWQHGLRLYMAFDRDAGARDVMETVRTAVELPESTGKLPCRDTASVH